MVHIIVLQKTKLTVAGAFKYISAPTSDNSAGIADAETLTAFERSEKRKK